MLKRFLDFRFLKFTCPSGFFYYVAMNTILIFSEKAPFMKIILPGLSNNQPISNLQKFRDNFRTEF